MGKKTKKDWRTFHKGDLIYTACGFPAFVYENQTMKEIVQIYAFGLYSEHGSEYVAQAIKTAEKETWFDACQRFGHSKEKVIETAKKYFNIEL